MSTYTDVLHEVSKRVDALVAKSAHLSEADALARVFRDDPGLYRAYLRESHGDPSPRPEATSPLTKASEDTPMMFSEALLGAKSHEVLSDLGDHLAALQQTLMRVLTSDTGDKAALAQQAIRDFTTATQARVERWLQPESHVDKSASRVQRLKQVRDALQRVVAAA
jgi:hypothetical protein